MEERSRARVEALVLKLDGGSTVQTSVRSCGSQRMQSRLFNQCSVVRMKASNSHVTL